jgi:hypothetical protein
MKLERGSHGVPWTMRVPNTFPNRNRPPDPNKGLTHFPFPRKIEKVQTIEGSNPINGLAPENHCLQNGDFTGDPTRVKPTFLPLSLCFTILYIFYLVT